MPLASESAEAWLARYAKSLVSELSGPIQVEAASYGFWQSLKCFEESEKAARAFAGVKLCKKEGGKYYWWSFAFKDQRLKVVEGLSGGGHGACPDLDGKVGRSLRSAGAAWRASRWPAILKRHASVQRGNARANAQEALRILMDPPKSSSMLEYVWAGRACPSSQPMVIAAALCCESLMWASPDARNMAICAFLSGLEKYFPNLCAQAEWGDGATGDLFAKLAGEARVTNCSGGWGGRVGFSRICGHSLDPRAACAPWVLNVEKNKYVKDSSVSYGGYCKWGRWPESEREMEMGWFMAARGMLFELVPASALLACMVGEGSGGVPDWGREAALGFMKCMLPLGLNNPIAPSSFANMLEACFSSPEDCLEFMQAREAGASAGVGVMCGVEVMGGTARIRGGRWGADFLRECLGDLSGLSSSESLAKQLAEPKIFSHGDMAMFEAWIIGSQAKKPMEAARSRSSNTRL